MAADWAAFTPWPALAGGALIGAAAAWLALLHGRVAGISGMLGGLLERRADWRARLAFLLGLTAAPALWWLAAGELPVVKIEAGGLRLLAAGLLVGVGAGLGSGCTSGHGVCGLARLSPRSLAATAAFMFAGFVTVAAVRHWGA
ncbi:YeeE/YedE family protein [Chromobacterium alkanivorans]|uniref:YeeE/YedE family protein n=1 Tax=Chromobacterium alkanivorans TaxID=1071719 RepID=UPI0019684F5D|nr:YeeE/YedE family protein [Chromobacterium alkanivorans]MBN3002135.1 YeeE/YedE family protein [Chromobacterium alkanivorans]